jgi:hypothetical protein
MKTYCSSEGKSDTASKAITLAFTPPLRAIGGSFGL